MKHLPLSPRVRDSLAAAAVAVTSSAVALQRPLFHDEASTWYGTAPGVREIFAYLDVHPPLYFLFTGAWFQVFGPDLTALRLASALFMAVGVYLFLRAVSHPALIRVLPVSSPALALLCATSPFLPFVGSFARYYALVCLLAALALWLMAKHLEAPSTPRAALLGLVSGTLFLTNYPAATLLIPLITLWFFRSCHGDGVRLSRTAFSVPLFLLCAAWLPFFLEQLEKEGPSAPAGAASMARSLVTAGGYMLYALLVGDGLPPWSVAGLGAAGLLLVVFLMGVTWGGRGTHAARRLVLVVAGLLLTGGVLGAVLLPGARSLFLPPRVAFLFFPVVLVLALACSSRARLSRMALAGALAANLTGLWGVLIARDTTVWAYQVPNREIARAVRQAAAEAAPPQKSGEAGVAFWYPAASLRNVLFTLGPVPSHMVVNHSGKGSRMQIVLSETRSPPWPPAEAVGAGPAGNPPGSWRLAAERFFLSEPVQAGRLKRLIAGREIVPHKLRLQVYVPAADAPSTASAPSRPPGNQ